ncbi:MAG: carboxylesterase family protein [Bacteroidota bacterium]
MISYILFRSSRLGLSLCVLYVLSMTACQQDHRIHSEALQLQQGLIEGSTQDGVHIFKGIPFAAPPIGELRWKAPQAAEHWTGTRICTEFAASPMQNEPRPFMMWSEEFMSPPGNLSEDCLYLNVWSAASSSQEKRPVFVWIYGGGFVSGSGACPIYDGIAMAQEGVVYVTFNYRVGVFGFLAHPELSQEAAYGSSGNYAILDQIAALTWIQENISVFGGDPNQVTIAGQSAGAFSVNALIASPLAVGLFQRTIVQSGGLMKTNWTQTLAEAEKEGQAFLDSTGLHTIQELRGKSTEEIHQFGSQYLNIGIVLDDHALPTDVLAHIQQGKHNDVPILTGWVKKDGSLAKPFENSEAYRLYLQRKFGAQAFQALSLFPEGATYMFGKYEKLFLCNFAVLQSHLLAKHTQHHSYVYEFQFVPTDKPDFPNYGAFHSAEVPFALHTLDHWNRPWQERDRKMETLMSTYWVNFAKSGNPNGDQLPTWEAYDAEIGNILLLNDTSIMEDKMYQTEIAFLSQFLTDDHGPVGYIE